MDADGKYTSRTVDAAGRLTEVIEDPTVTVDGVAHTGASDPILSTTYQYDSRGLLTAVSQGDRGRTFTYDGLGLLTQTVQPESGTTQYQYDAAGNLLKKIDALTQETSMQYDLLSRLVKRTYTAGPAETFCYDGTATGDCAGAPSATSGLLTGRMTMAANANATVKWNSFDELGRVKQMDQQVTGASTWTTEYQYNHSALNWMKYPSGRIVTYAFDDAGMISGVAGTGPDRNYASGMSYEGMGALKQMDLGNGLRELWTHSLKRGQVQSIQLGTAAAPTSVGELKFSYCDGAGFGTECSTNNGNLRQQRIDPVGEVQSYGYDALNRLATASGSGWSRTQGYDRYGNAFVSAWTGITPFATTALSAANFDANNRLLVNGAVYDNAGRMTGLGGTGGWVFGYNTTGMMVTSGISNGAATTYAYDALGRRVSKATGSVITRYAYDADGKLIAEYGGVQSLSQMEYMVPDHLGSTRMVTSGYSGQVTRRLDYLPFGEALLAGTGGRTSGQQYESAEAHGIMSRRFTGKERDGETASSIMPGLDYFGARYMAAAQGRFTSPDPLYIEAKRLLDPQSLNLYAYVRNNPLKFVDPDGMDFVLNCNGSQENCQQTVNDINNRKGAQFKVELRKNNKLQVVKGSIGKNLSANETALLGAVNDTKTTGTINVLGKDSSFNFEKYDSNGQNSIDRADLNVLGGANKELPGEVISHAMMESYSSAKNGSGYLPAHQFANRFYGQILIDTGNVFPIPNGSPMVTGIDTAYRFSRNGMDVSVIRTFDTPIPLATLRQRTTPPPGQVTRVTPIR